VIVSDVPVPRTGKPRAFVPTMGALHDGHRELMRVAREHVGLEGEVVVSVFVNPLQFGANEDFDHYPRTLDADTAVCVAEGVDILYAPTVATIYGANPAITVNPGPLGDELEGASRPGHFSGMLTVVAILFNQVAPDFAMFGEKDYQQLELVRRMCRDLSFPVSVVGVPTVREIDGLARSSRNVYLSADERKRAAAIPRALAAAGAGGNIEEIRAAAVAELNAAGLDIDYVEVRSNDLASALPDSEGRLLVAVHAGSTRLIDNGPVHVVSDGSV
jgi:pantoate--beta-alanine ligase